MKIRMRSLLCSCGHPCDYRMTVGVEHSKLLEVRLESAIMFSSYHVELTRTQVKRLQKVLQEFVDGEE